MNPSHTAHDIETLAARWAVRIDAGRAEPGEHAALEAWLAADPRHRGAFLRAQAGLRLLDHGSVVRKMLPLGAEGPASLRAAPRRIAPRLTLLAACLAVLMVLWPGDRDLSTAVGEQRRVTLQDGSVALINTDSRLDIAYAAGQRRIRLDRGEAWFQVARDHARPFIVDAGQVHVKATGTAFAVRRRGDVTRIVVTEGRVVAWSDGVLHPPITVSSGEEATIAGDGPVTDVRSTATDDVLAWRRGEIVFKGETVSAAAEEFNRYNSGKIIVRNRKAAEEKIVGYFLIDQPRQFARAVGQMSGGVIIEKGKDIIIE